MLEMLAKAIDDLAQARPLVAVDGADAAGKTTLAASLTTLVHRPVVQASVDGWHRPRTSRLRRGGESPEGYYRDSFDYPSLTTKLLDPFARGARHVVTAGYDYRADVAVEHRATVEPDAALLVDGVFLLRPELRSRWDLAIYLHIAEGTTLARAAKRDLDHFGTEAAVLDRYRRRYLPGQALYRREAEPMTSADIVLDNTDPDDPVVMRWQHGRRTTSTAPRSD